MRVLIILSFLFIQSLGAEKENAEARKLYEQSVQTQDDNEKMALRNQIAEKFPETSYGYFSKAFIEAEQRNYESAVELYSKAIKLNSKLFPAFGNRGEIYMKEFKDLQKAGKDFDSMIKLEPKNAEGYMRKCTVLFEQKKFNDALKLCDSAVQLAKDNALVYNTRGIVYANLKKLKQAHSDFSKAIELNESLVPAFWMRGRVSIELKNKGNACEDFKRASDMGSEEGRNFHSEFCTGE